MAKDLLAGHCRFGHGAGATGQTPGASGRKVAVERPWYLQWWREEGQLDLEEEELEQQGQRMFQELLQIQVRRLELMVKRVEQTRTMETMMLLSNLKYEEEFKEYELEKKKAELVARIADRVGTEALSRLAGLPAELKLHVLRQVKLRAQCCDPAIFLARTGAPTWA
jgi:hypothetical protein